MKIYINLIFLETHFLIFFIFFLKTKKDITINTDICPTKKPKSNYITSLCGFEVNNFSYHFVSYTFKRLYNRDLNFYDLINYIDGNIHKKKTNNVAMFVVKAFSLLKFVGYLMNLMSTADHIFFYLP